MLIANPSGDFRERQLAVQLLADFKRIYEEKAKGNKLAWVNCAVPSELFWALDIPPVEIDAVCGITAQNPEDAIPYIDRAHEVIPDYICSVNKIFLGAALSGDIPMPDMIVVPSHPIVKERMEKHKGRPSKERLRCIWIYGAPVFDFSFFSLLENKYGAFAVGNMNNNFIMKPVDDLSSLDSMLRGLASKTINLPMGRECGGPWENYIDAMIDLCKRFKADAAIFAGHVACKANWPIMKLVKDRIFDELGIPTLTFGLDLMDPRITSPETVKAQFDDFFSVHFPEIVPAGQ